MINIFFFIPLDGVLNASVTDVHSFDPKVGSFGETPPDPKN
jgi:hypothetical protein